MINVRMVIIDLEGHQAIIRVFHDRRTVQDTVFRVVTTVNYYSCRVPFSSVPLGLGTALPPLSHRSSISRACRMQGGGMSCGSIFRACSSAGMHL